MSVSETRARTVVWWACGMALMAWGCVPTGSGSGGGNAGGGEVGAGGDVGAGGNVASGGEVGAGGNVAAGGEVGAGGEANGGGQVPDCDLCLELNRECTEVGCGDCADGYTEEDGACRALRTCDDLGCRALNRACDAPDGADARCAECIEGFESEDDSGPCVEPDLPAARECRRCAAAHRECDQGPDGRVTCGPCLAGYVDAGAERGAACVRAGAELLCDPDWVRGGLDYQQMRTASLESTQEPPPPMEPPDDGELPVWDGLCGVPDAPDVSYALDFDLGEKVMPDGPTADLRKETDFIPLNGAVVFASETPVAPGTRYDVLSNEAAFEACGGEAGPALDRASYRTVYNTYFCLRTDEALYVFWGEAGCCGDIRIRFQQVSVAPRMEELP